MILLLWNDIPKKKLIRGMFIFPLADGTINMPDGHGGYKECWYGEVVKRLSKTNNEIKYFRWRWWWNVR
ncbi:MAG: hypothetical protein [Bacteriophage sp.]|nr:MAG: hypothetical protein [Bacteriophage sp.]